MHARMTTFAGLPPERVEPAIREFQEGQLPLLEQQAGFQGVFVLVNRSQGRAAALTLWETEEQMKASDKIADQARDSAVATTRPAREPIVDRFEVVVQK
jgi:heme-degrading monooxygenase HmoA